MGVLTKVRKNFSYVLLAGVIMASPGAVSTALADSGALLSGYHRHPGMAGHLV